MAEARAFDNENVQTDMADCKAFAEEDDLQTNIAEAGACADDDWQLDKPLVDCAAYLYMNEHLSDVTFVLTSETPARRVPAHKLILAMRSPVFEAMFFGPMKETNTEIIISEIPANGFLLMLRFLYTDWTDVTLGDATQCIQVAHMYRIPMCVQFCVNVLEQSLDVSNVCTILEIAVLYNLADLKEMCMKFIQTNAVTVLCNPGFLSAPLNVVELIVDDAKLKSEELPIYQALDNWATHQCIRGNVVSTHENKREYLGNAFSQLRLEDIALNDFKTSIVKGNLLSDKEKLAVYNYHHEIIPHLEFVNKDKRCQSSGSVTEDRKTGQLAHSRAWRLHGCITECSVVDIITYTDLTMQGAKVQSTAIVGRSSYFQTHAQYIMLYDRISCTETWHRVTDAHMSTDGTGMEVEWKDISLSANHEYQLFMFVCSFRKSAQKAASNESVATTSLTSALGLPSDTTISTVTPERRTNQNVTWPISGSLEIKHVYVRNE